MRVSTIAEGENVIEGEDLLSFLSVVRFMYTILRL